MRLAPFAAALLAATLTASSTLAQYRTLEPGDDVRVRAPALHRGPVRGSVVRYMADTLAVREAGTDSLIAFPMAQVRGIDRNEGVQRGRSVRHGVRVGAFLGAAVGLVVGPFLAVEGEEGDFVRNTALSGAGGTLAGGSLGALLGALFAGEHWQRFRVPRGACGAAPCPPPVTPAP